MAKLGIRKFQDLIGRTDLLRVSEKSSSKAKTLNFSLILKNALHMRPGVNIVGGSKRQVGKILMLVFTRIPKERITCLKVFFLYLICFVYNMILLVPKLNVLLLQALQHDDVQN